MQDGRLEDEAPGQEYYSIGLTLGNFFTVMRISMGDLELISSVEFMSEAEQTVFWIILMIIIIVNCIIFLNFIVAQAGSTYNTVSEQIESFIWQ